MPLRGTEGRWKGRKGGEVTAYPNNTFSLGSKIIWSYSGSRNKWRKVTQGKMGWEMEQEETEGRVVQGQDICWSGGSRTERDKQEKWPWAPRTANSVPSLLASPNVPLGNHGNLNTHSEALRHEFTITGCFWATQYTLVTTNVTSGIIKNSICVSYLSCDLGQVTQAQNPVITPAKWGQ
jgi:hypothetical protein